MPAVDVDHAGRPRGISGQDRRVGPWRPANHSSVGGSPGQVRILWRKVWSTGFRKGNNRFPGLVRTGLGRGIYGGLATVTGVGRSFRDAMSVVETSSRILVNSATDDSCASWASADVANPDRE